MISAELLSRLMCACTLTVHMDVCIAALHALIDLPCVYMRMLCPDCEFASCISITEGFEFDSEELGAE